MVKQAKRKIALRKVKPPIEGYKELVAHICETFKQKKGSPYPFSGESGAQVKRLLYLYGLYQSMAMWDLFLMQNWDWVKDGKKIRVGHDLRNFQSKITILVEDNWKAIADKYEEESKAKFQPELPIEIKEIPKEKSFQTKRNEAINELVRH